jgi:hypothetical protein
VPRVLLVQSADHLKTWQDTGDIGSARSDLLLACAKSVTVCCLPWCGLPDMLGLSLGMSARPRLALVGTMVAAASVWLSSVRFSIDARGRYMKAIGMEYSHPVQPFTVAPGPPLTQGTVL